MKSLPVKNLHFELKQPGRPMFGDPIGPRLELRVWAKDLPHVDRAHDPIAQWMFPLHHKQMAERLLDAIAHGKVFRSYTIKVDGNGKTYYMVEMNGPFNGKHMDAALRQVGY